jgi:hypothetical protein
VDATGNVPSVPVNPQIGLARFGFVQPHGRSAVVAVGLKKTAAKEDL